MGEERNSSLTQTMRLLKRSFQGLRKAYNPVYRARKSEDIHSLVFVLPFYPPLAFLGHPSRARRETRSLPLIPFHFTSIFYEPSCSTAGDEPLVSETSERRETRVSILHTVVPWEILIFFGKNVKFVSHLIVFRHFNMLA